MDHFQVVVDTLPRSAFGLPTVSTRGVVDAMSAFGQASRHIPAMQSDVMGDEDGEQQEGPVLDPASVTFFKVIKSRPSNWHTVPMSRAAGSKLKASDVVISLHTGIKQDDSLVLSVSKDGILAHQCLGSALNL